MNNSAACDWRSKQSLNHLSIHTMNYSSYSLPDTTKKAEMKNFCIYSNELEKDQNLDVKMEVETVNSWFIKSAARVFGSIVRKLIRRASSPDLSYHDCESRSDESSPRPSRWQYANTENKNIQAQDSGTYTDYPSEMNGDCISVVAACEDKLNKVRQLITSKTVLTSPKCHSYRSRRRKKVFVEAGSVEESFVDAFSPEDFVSVANNSTLAYLVPLQCQKQEYCEVDSPKTKVQTGPVSIVTAVNKTLKDTDMAPNHTDVPPQETVMAPKVMDTALKDSKTIPTMTETSLKASENTQDKAQLNLKSDGLEHIIEPKSVENLKPETEKPLITKTQDTIASCESKMLQLHALLRRKNKNSLNLHDSVPESDKERTITKPKVIPIAKSQDKRFKNPNRTPDKRKKCMLQKIIQDDMLFADELLTEDVSSAENSPCANKLHEISTSNDEDYFDEIAGRFRKNSTTESEDSFQVVFADSPRSYRPSDCESEDSFIFFEDSPDSCYTSNDVFGDESDSESEYSDSEVSDSGCSADELKMQHSMSKTVGNLTDNALYDEDEATDQVDCAIRMCEEVPSQELDLEPKQTGLLMNDDKKLIRKSLPPKKVHFSEKPPKIHVMRVWAFAARQARAGNWERHALDRERFKRRIADADMALSWVLKPQHRSRVMFQRFMPWWNAQKRKELAEKKQRQEEEKRKKEEEEMKEQELERKVDIKGNTEESDNLEVNSGSEVNDSNVKNELEDIDKNKCKSDTKLQENKDLGTLDKVNIDNEFNEVNTQIVNVNSFKNSEKNMCNDSDIINDSLKISDTKNSTVEELNRANKQTDECFKKIELILTPSNQNYALVPVDVKEDKVST